jgi:predicted enzyme related to lactoylglutathione lyase
VFGRITPVQKERLVTTLRARGHYVAMIGDGVNDVLSLKKADLAIAMGSGSQATRGVADLVLMQDSFAAVAQAVEEGQRILNGMQDILKLFLTRIATVGLVVVSSLVVVTFPIELRNASALTVFTVGIPSAPRGVGAARPAVRDSLDRTLARFVVPAAVVSSLMGLMVFYLVLALSNPGGGRSTSRPATRTALTSFLVFVGLFLILFVEPPIPWFAAAEDDRGQAAGAARRRARDRLRRDAAGAAGPRVLPADRAGAPRRTHRDPRGRCLGTAGQDVLGPPGRRPVPRPDLTPSEEALDVLPRVTEVVIDSADHGAVVDFWAAAMGYERREVSEAVRRPRAATAAEPGRPPILFQKVPEPKVVKNRVHLDFQSEVMADEVARLVALGASVIAERSLGDFTWTVLADPAGNEFCVS